ncbi:MAG TPA: ATP-binding cassette domain-containing protein, partial [Desulfomicrobiaceae bacterium]|nr:ATP-binding cassette domain-containing protein [Desulfomicrobiaceae bacterium]
MQQNIAAPHALELNGISKRFGPVVALEEVSFHLGANEILGLVGDNGAGKSSLVKVLSGVNRPDSGRFFIGGEA